MSLFGGEDPHRKKGVILCIWRHNLTETSHSRFPLGMLSHNGDEEAIIPITLSEISRVRFLSSKASDSWCLNQFKNPEEPMFFDFAWCLNQFKHPEAVFPFAPKTSDSWCLNDFKHPEESLVFDFAWCLNQFKHPEADALIS